MKLKFDLKAPEDIPDEANGLPEIDGAKGFPLLLLLMPVLIKGFVSVPAFAVNGLELIRKLELNPVLAETFPKGKVLFVLFSSITGAGLTELIDPLSLKLNFFSIFILVLVVVSVGFFSMLIFSSWDDFF